MKSIAIIYGSSTEHTKNAAEKMAELLADYSPTLSDIYDGDETPFLTHDVLIMGVSTWGVQDLQDDWNDFYPKLEKLDLTGKTVALFGLGDASIYPSSYVDAMGILYEIVIQKGATVIGEVSPEGYDFEYSRALKEGKFVGLPLDDDYEPELTEERIINWLETLKPYFE
ncbi:flavodoxin [Proteiniphilum sp.]|nr:flavodoxin [Proteiniphilum sp.]MEA4916507.1 flavodoxin [Proteiniphilum sp.]